MKPYILVAALSLAMSALAAPHGARAHPGGLDAQGCHTNRKTGGRHCHSSGRAPSAPALPPSPLAGAVKYRNCEAARAAGAVPVRRGDRATDRIWIETMMASAASRTEGAASIRRHHAGVERS